MAEEEGSTSADKSGTEDSSSYNGAYIIRFHPVLIVVALLMVIKVHVELSYTCSDSALSPGARQVQRVLLSIGSTREARQHCQELVSYLAQETRSDEIVNIIMSTTRNLNSHNEI